MPGTESEWSRASGSIWGVVVPGCSGGKPFYIAEVPSPVLRATGKASLEDLRSFILSLPKLSPSVRLLLQDVNLSTGVVPLPIPAQVQAEKVTTHGVQGVLMVDSSLSLGAILWQRDGIIYLVAGEPVTRQRSRLAPIRSSDRRAEEIKGRSIGGETVIGPYHSL